MIFELIIQLLNELQMVLNLIFKKIAENNVLLTHQWRFGATQILAQIVLF